ncbi:MAG: SulP family inorganic anion transporter [Cytophagales bacterium]
MVNKKIWLSQFDGFKDIKSDLFSGLIVFFVAMPMSLGIAKACGAPFYSGLVSSVIGGLLLCFLSPSKLSIKGMPAGLSTIVLLATIELGNGDLAAGYSSFLVCAFFSGLLMVLFSFLNAGMIADLVPSSVVKGMLSALGLMIAVSQLPTILGSSIPLSKPIDVILNLSTVWESQNRMTFVMGGIAILILSLSDLFPLKLFKYFPPVLLMIFLSVIGVVILKNQNPSALQSMEMVNLKANVSSELIWPGWKTLSDLRIWQYVSLITLVAIIESTLSLKAIERNNHENQKTDYNLDLRAIGIGTSISSLIGGLPIITVVRRSIINIQAGAKTQKSNLFHGFFVLIALFSGSYWLNYIPVASLAAILIYSGIKFITPNTLFSNYKIGLEQGIVYSVTLLSIFLFGIVPGVLLGIITEFAVYLMMGVKWGELLNPNYTIEYSTTDRAHVLKINGSALFSNFFILRKVLERVPKGGNVLFDFSKTKLIDHTFLEHLYFFENQINSNGGQIGVKGLEFHQNMSKHPLATKKILNKEKLSERETEWLNWAEDKGFSFIFNGFEAKETLQEFCFSSVHNIEQTLHTVKGMINEHSFYLAEILLNESDSRGKLKHLKVDLMIIELSDWEHYLPEFTLEKESFGTTLLPQTNLNDINFDEFPNFSFYYLLKGEDENYIRTFFDLSIIRFFETHKGFAIEVKNNKMLILRNLSILNINQIEQMYQFGCEWMTVLNQRQSKKAVV